MDIFELRALVSNIEYKDWTFVVKSFGLGDMYLQVRFKTVNCRTGEPYEANGRKWLISQHAVASEVVGTAMKAVLTAEEHEIRECFKFRGKAVYNPHINIEALIAVSDSLEVRPPKPPKNPDCKIKGCPCQLERELSIPELYELEDNHPPLIG